MPPLPPRPLPSYTLLAILLPLASSLIVHPLVSSSPHSLPALEASVGFSLLALLGSLYVVPALSEAFVEKGFKGKDMLKVDGAFV
jgi:UDP-N-acetylglucosamine--dolichyl-phosphate N-acetylglucosaminephosphotransferase